MSGVRALIISADRFEDSELLFPYYRLKEEGVHVDIASMKGGKIKGKHGYEVAVDKTLEEVSPEEYDILILPGGKAPDLATALTATMDANRVMQAFYESRKV